MRLSLFALLPLLLIPQSALAAILAVDYGSEWIKASLVKPGTPFDVLLNKDSKRKIQASVGWKRDDRVFGQDAFNLVRPSPQKILTILINFARLLDSLKTLFHT